MASRIHQPEQPFGRYAVLWSGFAGTGSGRLDVLEDRFVLTGRGVPVNVVFANLVDASIKRGRADRLGGLPALHLRQRDGQSLRVASLEGSGALHELVRLVET
jgi:hypothetical protein